MLPKIELAPWLKSVMLVGFEGEESAVGEGDPAEGAEGETGESTEVEDSAKLKKALAAERLRSKNLEKKLRDAAASKGDEEESEESEEEGEEPKKPVVKKSPPKGNSAADKKLAALTAAFRQTTAKDLVRDIASNFQDSNDAYESIDWRLISFEQDDDDPSNVVWDESEIRTAIKDLAKRKPYLLKPAGDSTPPKTPGRPSGSKFGGAGKPSTTDTKAQLAGYQQRFPAMRGVRGPQG